MCRLSINEVDNSEGCKGPICEGHVGVGEERKCCFYDVAVMPLRVTIVLGSVWWGGVMGDASSR